MKFSEIANRLTGISTPFGGASWQPAELEIAGARRVIAFLGEIGGHDTYSQQFQAQSRCG